jgi:hypothetical protein
MFQVLKHDGCVIDGSNGIRVFDSIDKFPQLQGMSNVGQGEDRVPVCMFE